MFADENIEISFIDNLLFRYKLLEYPTSYP